MTETCIRAAAVLRAELPALQRPEQARIIGDLGDGRHRGARRSAAGALLDGQHGRKPVDEIDVGPSELLEHLPRLRGQALHVLAVPLGVEGVENQRRLARTARTGDDHEFAAGQTQFEILQVVLSRALDVNVRRRVHHAITS
jgi:hypothetical protein